MAKHGETKQRIYMFVKRYMLEHGYAPSYREIAEGVGIKSTSTIQHHIDVMLVDVSLETDLDGLSPRALRVGKWVW